MGRHDQPEHEITAISNEAAKALSDRVKATTEPLPKPARNWPTIAGFVVACTGFVWWPLGPVGLLLAAIGLKRAGERHSVVLASLALGVALLACARGMIALGDLLMAR